MATLSKTTNVKVEYVILKVEGTVATIQYTVDDELSLTRQVELPTDDKGKALKSGPCRDFIEKSFVPVLREKENRDKPVEFKKLEGLNGVFIIGDIYG